MTTTLPANLAPAKAPAAVPSAPVLEAMAAQIRPGGIGLLVLGGDGAVRCHDAQAGVFFERYVLPLLQQPDLAGHNVASAIGRIEAASAPQAWDFIPGVQLCAAPLVERRQVAGVLLLAAKDERFSLDEDVLGLCSKLGLDSVWLGERAATLPSYSRDRLLTAMHLLLGMARDKLRLLSMEEELKSLSTQLANAYEELTLIDQISGGMRVNRRAVEFFRQACLDVMQVICVRGMGVVVNCEKMRTDPVLYGELSLPPGQVQRLSQQLLETLRQRKNCVLVNDLGKDRTFAWLGEWARHLIAVPLQRQDQVLGCLFGLDKTTGEFDSVDAKLLTSIANESAIYLENALLFRDVHDLMMGMLHSLTSAVDAKDAYTCGHSERVALLSRHLAQQIKLPDSAVDRIYMAGLLHDVGKIGVSELVLQKTGRLTAEEFEQMKKHVQVGARIMADVKQMEDVIPGLLHHHERYDGRGYPAGLAGKNIPLAGRIICLADCMDAMTSNRTYRKALPLEVAMCEIRRCSGTQFDPELAEVFLRSGADHFRAMLRDHQLNTKGLIELQEALRAA